MVEDLLYQSEVRDNSGNRNTHKDKSNFNVISMGDSIDKNVIYMINDGEIYKAVISPEEQLSLGIQ